MEIIQTSLDGVFIIKPKIIEDQRGFFMESYNKAKFQDFGMEFNFVQDNHSFSVTKDVLRGLHYQINPKAQAKLVRVIAGSIFDVVVDLRKSSSTFGQWFGITLSSENNTQLLVTSGFAHGFCTLEPNTEVLYKVDEYYSPKYERGILWNDPDLGIDWPTSSPILSYKDQKHPLLKDTERWTKQ